MDPKSLLEQLLQSGKKLTNLGREQGSELVAKGKELATEGAHFVHQNLGLPEAGPERDRMLSHVGAGAAAGGVLALLMGSRRGRNAFGRLAKIGSLAAMGALGYKIYSDYRKASQTEEMVDTDQELAGEQGNVRCLKIIQAMISAAKADGVIDAGERVLIEDRIRQSDLSPPVINTLLAEIQKPLSIPDVASLAQTPIDAVDIYLASLVILEDASENEKKYLATLAEELDMDQALVHQLESEAFKPI